VRRTKREARRYERSEPRIARRKPQKKHAKGVFFLCAQRLAQIELICIKYDGKISLCYFSLVLFSKSALRLILKIKAALFET
jgi:hypothetical protein